MPLAWERILSACAAQEVRNEGMCWVDHAERATLGDNVSRGSNLVMERSLFLHLEVSLIKILSTKICCPIF